MAEIEKDRRVITSFNFHIYERVKHVWGDGGPGGGGEFILYFVIGFLPSLFGYIFFK